MSQALGDVFDEIPAGCGPVGLLSSDEFLPVADAFDRALLSVTGKRIALIFAADPRGASNSARLATGYYRRLDAEPVVVDVLIRDDARTDALPDYDVLFLAGGSPAALLATLRDTPLWAEALRRWRTGVALAGSSAGAMALCLNSLVPEPGDRRPSRWATGLGPIERVALAVHAKTAPAEWLRHVGETAPVPVVALDEGVGVVLTANAAPVLAGDGSAWVLGKDR
jgi:putative intracellular protease/amidase